MATLTETITSLDIPTSRDVYNQGLRERIERYPRTGAARYWIEQYNYLTEFDGKEPTAIHIHQVWQEYVSPAEGGCWDELREPLWDDEAEKPDISTICIFNKKQCIRECLSLTEHHALPYQMRIDTTANNMAIDVTLDHGYCQSKYPAPYC